MDGCTWLGLTRGESFGQSKKEIEMRSRFSNRNSHLEASGHCSSGIEYEQCQTGIFQKGNFGMCESQHPCNRQDDNCASSWHWKLAMQPVAHGEPTESVQSESSCFHRPCPWWHLCLVLCEDAHVAARIGMHDTRTLKKAMLTEVNTAMEITSLVWKFLRHTVLQKPSNEVEQCQNSASDKRMHQLFWQILAFGVLIVAWIVATFPPCFAEKKTWGGGWRAPPRIHLWLVAFAFSFEQWWRQGSCWKFPCALEIRSWPFWWPFVPFQVSFVRQPSAFCHLWGSWSTTHGLREGPWCQAQGSIWLPWWVGCCHPPHQVSQAELKLRKTGPNC